jgi:hypothetical protein
LLFQKAAKLYSKDTKDKTMKGDKIATKSKANIV